MGKIRMISEQITLAQQSFEKVLPAAETVAELFYRRLFELDPSLRRLFTGDMQAQGRKLMDMIQTVIYGLDQFDKIIPTVQDLGRHHGGLGVKDKDYDTVAAALLWTLEHELGPDFTPVVKKAWIEVYGLLANTMKAAASELN